MPPLQGGGTVVSLILSSSLLSSLLNFHIQPPREEGSTDNTYPFAER